MDLTSFISFLSFLYFVSFPSFHSFLSSPPPPPPSSPSPGTGRNRHALRQVSRYVLALLVALVVLLKRRSFMKRIMG